MFTESKSFYCRKCAIVVSIFFACLGTFLLASGWTIMLISGDSQLFLEFFIRNNKYQLTKINLSSAIITCGIISLLMGLICSCIVGCEKASCVMSNNTTNLEKGIHHLYVDNNNREDFPPAYLTVQLLNSKRESESDQPHKETDSFICNSAKEDMDKPPSYAELC